MALRAAVSRCVRMGVRATSLPTTTALKSANTLSLRQSSAEAVVLPVMTMSVRHFAKAKKQNPGKSNTKTPPSADSVGDDAVEAMEKTKKSMHGAVLNFTRVLNQMRPGKADAGIFDDLHVQAYGQHVALPQLAQVAVSGSHSLSVMVYDPSLLVDIKKAIEAMNPVYSIREDGNSLEISFPKMSKETRAELLKAAKKQAEQARQHVRRVRQDAMSEHKKRKDEISEDDIKRLQDQVQKLTDNAVAEIGKLLAAKEKDLTAV